MKQLLMQKASEEQYWREEERLIELDSMEQTATTLPQYYIFLIYATMLHMNALNNIYIISFRESVYGHIRYLIGRFGFTIISQRYPECNLSCDQLYTKQE
jgi:hypothetical protein